MQVFISLNFFFLESLRELGQERSIGVVKENPRFLAERPASIVALEAAHTAGYTAICCA